MNLSLPAHTVSIRSPTGAAGHLSVVLVLLILLPKMSVAEICWDYTDLEQAKVPLKCVQMGDMTTPCSWNPSCNTDLNPNDCCVAVPDPSVTQTVGEMHVMWHNCLGNVGTNSSPPPPNRGLRWYAFHRQLEWDFNVFRESLGFDKIDSLEWCPGMTMPYGHFGAGLAPGTHPLGCGTGINRPNNRTCDGCETFSECLYIDGAGPGSCIEPPQAGCSVGGVSFPYTRLQDFQNVDEVATLLDAYFHGDMHGAVSDADGGGYNADCANPNCSTRDGMFWRLHKALDDVVRAWQDLQAVDVTLVVDRSGSMSAPSGTGVGSRLDNAVEAADMFADLLEEGRSDGGVNRIGIVSYSSTAGNAALNLPLQDVDANLRNPGGAFATTLAALGPGGSTSIGAGVEAAVAQLCPGGSCATHVPAVGENERKAILLLTDGKENRAPCLEAGCEGGSGAEIDYGALDVMQLCGGTRAILTDTRSGSGAAGILRCAGAQRVPEIVNRNHLNGGERFLKVKAALQDPGHAVFSYAVVPVVDDLGGAHPAAVFASHGQRDEGPGAIVGHAERGSDLDWHKNVLVTGLSQLTAFAPRSVPYTGDPLYAGARILPSFLRAGGYPGGRMTVEVERPTRGLGGLVKRRVGVATIKDDAVDSVELDLGKIAIPTTRDVFALNDEGKDGDLHPGNGTYTAKLPINAAVDGMCTFHYRFEYPSGGCTTRRELKQTLFVDVRVSPPDSKVDVGPPTRDCDGQVYPVRILPQDALGNVVGPGRRPRPATGGGRGKGADGAGKLRGPARAMSVSALVSGRASVGLLALAAGIMPAAVPPVAEAPTASTDASFARNEPAEYFTEVQLRRILKLSPLPPLPDDPSNAVANDPRAAALGERLFFDPSLSGDGRISCATCHDPQLHWSDGRRTSDPVGRFPKNVPSLWNTAYNRWFFWDGRADSAWAQALGPLESPAEMGSNRMRIVHLIRRDPGLRAAYGEVFGPLPEALDDPTRFPEDAAPNPQQPGHPQQLAWAAMSAADRDLADRVFTGVGKVLAAFERRIITCDTPFDRFVAALRDGEVRIGHGADALSESATRGLKLFIGRAQCSLCHSGPLLSDGEFHDVGIALGTGMRVDPGRHRGVLTLLRSPFARVGRYADAADPGAPIQFLRQQTDQLGQFKTPSLRGVADTAPYMHDGRFDSLDEVVRFYSTREGASPLGHPTTLLQRLDLDAGEVADLVTFLERLSPPIPMPRVVDR